MDRIEERIIAIIDSNRSRILDFANDIYHNAELGYKEFRTSEKFQKFMEERVGRVEDNLAVTGVKAYLNEEKKENFSLALIGELDALRIPDHKCVNTKTEAAHCCGHHAQLAGVIGAALALTEGEIAEKLDGQIVFLAAPAEEYGEIEFKKSLMEQGKIGYGGGKCELIRIGAFDDIDACLAHHVSMKGITTGSGSTNGFVSKVITIKGRAAHAAAEKEKGVNALSAAALGLQGLAFNRETFRDEDCIRVHPIMTKGGNLVNVVPDEAVIETLVRGKTKEAFSDAAIKTDRSFKAGAMALGAGYRIETMPGYLPSLPQAMPEEIVEVIREAAAGKEVYEESLESHEGGSTDVGDVQHLMPVLTFHTGGVSGGLHQSEFAVYDEDESYILTAKIFALGAYRMLKDGAALGKKVRDEYKPIFKSKKEYTEFLDKFYSVEEGELWEKKITE